MILLLVACTAPPGPPTVLLSGEARGVASLTLDGERVDGTAPFEVDGALHLDGSEMDEVPVGYLRYVEVAEDAVVADDWEIGVEVERDVALLLAEDPTEPLAWLADGLTEEEPGVWRLDQMDVWEVLVRMTDAQADAFEGAVEEVVPVWIEEGSVAAQAAAGTSAGRGQSARTEARGSTWGDGLGAAGDALGEGTGDATIDAALAAQLAEARAAREAEALAWVGLYSNDDECVLLDLSGTFRTCADGLTTVRGAWRPEGATLWLGDDAWPADADRRLIDMGGDPLVRNAQMLVRTVETP